MNRKMRFKPGDVVRAKRGMILQGIMCHGPGMPPTGINKGQLFAVRDEAMEWEENQIVIEVNEYGGYTVNANDFQKTRLIGNRNNIFNIVENFGVPHERVRQFLVNLPIVFRISKTRPLTELKGEPLEVRIDHGRISISPPRGRVISCTTFDYRKNCLAIRKMRIDKIMDFVPSGFNGKIRSYIYFDPAILGVKNWPSVNDEDHEIELKIFAYPKP